MCQCTPLLSTLVVLVLRENHSFEFRLLWQDESKGKCMKGMDEELVVVVGGSGYLGLHLLQELAGHGRLAFTYFSQPPPPLNVFPDARPFQVDLQSGEGLHSISDQLGPPRVVVNCAAISIPRECEADPSRAMAVNVPHALLNWLSSLASKDPPLLVHLSTDQVYEGTKSFYKEDDEARPVNAYGRSKLAGEQVIMKSWPNYAILRSSIIFGPQPVVPVPKTLPIQWIESVLYSGKGGDFFDDEYRCPVFVKDVVKVVELLIKKRAQGNTLQLLLNVGGPQRLSRADMAEVVSDIRGFDKSLVRHVPAASVNRGVVSPADISMCVNRLMTVLNFIPTSFQKGVELTLAKQ